MKILGEWQGKYIVVEGNQMGFLDIELLGAIEQRIIHKHDLNIPLGHLWNIQVLKGPVIEPIMIDEYPNIVRAVGQYELSKIQVSDEFY